MKSSLVLGLSLAVASVVPFLSGCGDDTAAPPPSSKPGAGAPPPEGVPANDPAVRRYERAAPPELQALVGGRFQPLGDRASEATGAIVIADHSISAERGTEAATERIAIVRGDDQYRPGERYSNLLMVGAEQPVELRRVYPAVVDSAADAPAATSDTRSAPEEAGAADAGRGPPLCADGDADFVALVALKEGDRHVVRLAGLRGRSTPAAGATDVEACEVLEYEAKG